MKLEGLPALGRLPQKNVRRDNHTDIKDYFKTTILIDKVLERYAIDFKKFYADYSVDNLINGDPLKKKPPLQKAKRSLRAKTIGSPDKCQ